MGLKLCEQALHILNEPGISALQWKTGAEAKIRVQMGRIYRDLELHCSTTRDHAAEQFAAARQFAKAAGDAETAHRAAYLNAGAGADFTSQIDLARAALVEAEATSSTAHIASACIDLAGAHFRNGDLSEALGLYERAMAFFKAPDQGNNAAVPPPPHVLICIGTIHLMAGRAADSTAALEQATAFQGAGDGTGLSDADRVALSELRASACDLLQRAYLRLGRPADALVACDRGRAQVLTYDLHRQGQTAAAATADVALAGAGCDRQSAVSGISRVMEGGDKDGPAFGDIESLSAYVREENVTAVSSCSDPISTSESTDSRPTFRDARSRIDSLPESIP